MKKHQVAALVISLFSFILCINVVSAQVNNSNHLKNKQQVSAKQESHDIKSDGAGDDYLNIGFDLMHKESLGSLKLGLSGAAVRNLLGEPIEKSKQVIWGADGEEHQTWYYKSKGIELDMMGPKNKQVINMITIKKPCTLKTGRNIGIGSTKKEVLKAYKKEINQDNANPKMQTSPDAVVAGTIYGGLIFNFQKDQVSTILIGATAE